MAQTRDQYEEKNTDPYDLENNTKLLTKVIEVRGHDFFLFFNVYFQNIHS